VRVLRSVNSAAFSPGQPITSIRHALVLLGIQQVRKWASVWAMAGLNGSGTPALVSIALVRARCCELLGNAWSGCETGSELFLLGLCSVLDAMVDQPMEMAIAGLPLSAGIRHALLGRPNAARSVLDAVIAPERGEWDHAADGARTMGLPDALLRVAYADALVWATALTARPAAA
jgi:EAL and modified HD-GYP domain-containing signal transduction protein